MTKPMPAGHDGAERAGMFSLAAALMSYPDEELSDWSALARQGALDAAGSGVSAEAWGPLRAALIAARPETLDDLRSSYISLFERGKGLPLYETEYTPTRAMGKGAILADIAGFYRAFGMELGEEDGPEMADHFAVELEFYAVLLAKQTYLDGTGDSEGAAIVRDARAKFLGEHLAALSEAACPRIEGREEAQDGAGLHGAAMRFCLALVRSECGRLGVQPPRASVLSVVPPSSDPDEVCCGGSELE